MQEINKQKECLVAEHSYVANEGFPQIQLRTNAVGESVMTNDLGFILPCCVHVNLTGLNEVSCKVKILKSLQIQLP